MKIIDSHVHFWDLSQNMNSWVLKENNPALTKNYLPQNLISLFKDNLDGVLHVEAHDSNISTFKEIEWLSQIIKGTPNLKYAHIAYLDITLPNQDFVTMLKELKKYPQLVGVRHILSYNPKFHYSPCDFDLSNHKNIPKNIESLASHDLIFNCQMYPYQLENILPVIASSKVKCVIDHMALPAWNKYEDEDYILWHNLIEKLIDYDTISLKLSRMDNFKDETEFNNILKFCFTNIPITKLIYASNYPVSYTDNYNYWFEYLSNMKLSDNEKNYLFYKNAFNLFFNKI